MIDDRSRLVHFRDAIDAALEFAAAGRETFLTDRKTRFAVERAIEMIGEAVKGISGPFQDAHADVPWRQIASMRDRLIHGYFIVDLKVVWLVVERDLPPLRRQVEGLLQQFPADAPSEGS
jgi:uncharacterized protein with HEPN domain